jgi:hypothetical protein
VFALYFRFLGAPASARQRVLMRYALTYPKWVLLRAFGFENGARHTRLEAVFALMSGLLSCFLGAFFASQKTGLCGGSAAMHGLQPCAAAASRPYNPLRGRSYIQVKVNC